MESVLRKIYRGEYCPGIRKFVRDDKEEDRLMREYTDMIGELKTEFSEEMQGKIKKCFQACSSYYISVAENDFIEGVQLGARLMLSMLGEKKTTPAHVPTDEENAAYEAFAASLSEEDEGAWNEENEEKTKALARVLMMELRVEELLPEDQKDWLADLTDAWLEFQKLQKDEAFEEGRHMAR